MLVLIGCEESQTVCKEFRELGHEAFSCDLKECSGGHPEWHLQMDIFKAIDLMEWGFIGLHPVCTKMTLSGNRHYAPGKEKNFERLEAVELTGLTNIIYFPMPRFKRIGKIYTTTRGTGSWDKNTVSEIKLRKSKGIDEYGNVTQVNRRVR